MCMHVLKLIPWFIHFFHLQILLNVSLTTTFNLLLAIFLHALSFFFVFQNKIIEFRLDFKESITAKPLLKNNVLMIESILSTLLNTIAAGK